MKQQGNSLLETRRKNRVLIKNSIFRTRNATRTGVANELGLTLATISTSVNEMMKENILEEVPINDESMDNLPGRKPNAIRFCRDCALAIGIELGPYFSRSVLIDMSGEVIKAAELGKAAEDYDEMLLELKELIERVYPEDDEKLVGIGIGLPGFIDSDGGKIRSNPRKNWDGKRLADDVRRMTNKTIFMDNNVRIRAVGYNMSVKDDNPDTMAYFYVSRGIACPLMFRSESIAGISSGAGEIGQSILQISDNGKIIYKTVDELASERAIFERCQELMLEGRMKALKVLVEKEGILKPEMIAKLQEEGDEEVCGVLNEVIVNMGIILSNVVNLINPDCIVVDSYIMQRESNRKLLAESAREHFYGLNEEEVNIHFTEYDKNRGATSAALYVIQKAYLNA